MGVYIIAEAGVNHNGSIETAKKLVDAAKKAGADCVKFQTFKADNIVTQCAKKAAYQLTTTNKNESQYEMLKKLELSEQAFIELKAYCESKYIKFLSTPFDLESIELLHKIGMNVWKIPSSDIDNLPYIKRIAEFGEPILLSTGMCTLEEVEKTVNLILEMGNTKITLLHCTTEYPAPYEAVNLKAMSTMSSYFSLETGYSDHTVGIEIPIAAAAMGAVVIEKHFTLDKNMEGPDHKASLEPKELEHLVNAVRNVECALGNGIKTPFDIELKNKKVARKSIVAKGSIKKGERFNEENLTVKRPGTGISPMEWNNIIGTEAKQDYCKDEMIRR